MFLAVLNPVRKGCFSDPNNDLLTDEFVSFPGELTKDLCVSHCLSRGYEYSGIKVS